jgi:hypothetical protein
MDPNRQVNSFFQKDHPAGLLANLCMKTLQNITHMKFWTTGARVRVARKCGLQRRFSACLRASLAQSIMKPAHEVGPSPESARVCFEPSAIESDSRLRLGSSGWAREVTAEARSNGGGVQCSGRLRGVLVQRLHQLGTPGGILRKLAHFLCVALPRVPGFVNKALCPPHLSNDRCLQAHGPRHTRLRSVWRWFFEITGGLGRLAESTDSPP